MTYNIDMNWVGDSRCIGILSKVKLLSLNIANIELNIYLYTQYHHDIHITNTSGYESRKKLVKKTKFRRLWLRWTKQRHICGYNTPSGWYNKEIILWIYYIIVTNWV